MAKSKKKRLKLEEKPETTTTSTTVNTDMISTLPDSLLCHILSFLPTRSAMATSILSRRWRHLWKDLQVFDLAAEPFDENEKRFVAFVNAVLARRNSRHIRKLRLSCELSQHRAFRRWIRAVTGPHLQELHLSLSVSREDEYEEFDLPEGVFTCESLVSLALKRCINLIYRDFPHVHLPSLKNLEVDVCRVSPDKLLSGCPVVENLKLVLRSIDYRAPSIHVPRSLKRLTLEDDDCICFDHVELLEILAPSLEYLHLNIAMIPCSRVSVSDFPNMVEAHLDIYPHDVHVGWVPALLKALCMAKLLVLEAYTVECLLRAPALDFPEFCRLVHLELGIPCFNMRFLIKSLHYCNMLQVLVIHSRMGAYPRPLEYSVPGGWTLPTKVPNCVMSHLQTFEFRRYQDSADEHAFIAYLLQRGLVLKTVTILTDGFSVKKKYHILKKLSSVPRGSNICQLNFD